MPIAHIFAGVNGGGKTTLYYNGLEKGFDFGFRINIDEIVGSFGNLRDFKDQKRGAKIAESLKRSCIIKQMDFNYETTLGSNDILEFFREILKHNYNICLYYVGVNSVDVAKLRVASRVAKGGHSASEKAIEKSFEESLKKFKKIIQMCSEAHLFDNTFEFVKFASIKNRRLQIFERPPLWGQDCLRTLKLNI